MRRFALALALLVAPRLAQAQPAEDPPPPPPQPQPAPSEAPPPGGAPPPHYYVEPADPGAARPASPAPAQAPAGVYEPPPPGYGYAPALVYEPPPPPKPRHVAPKYSFWVGARLGWFVPFGNVWAQGTPRPGFVQFEGVSWSDYASSGPMVEVDVGARLGRNYNLFLLWEHAALGRGSALTDEFGGQETGDTDFIGIGLRVSSDPDRVGFLTEIDLGARRFRAVWGDGRELQLAQAPFEARLGLGADIRLGRAFSLSPLLTLGIGAFGSAEWVYPDGSVQAARGALDEDAGHGWFTVQIGGHFDIGGGG